MIYSIYKIIFSNNKVYVGITSRSIEERLLEHKSNANKENPKLPIHRAIKKYGWTNVETLYQSKNKQDIYEKETYFINLYKSNNDTFGYNLTLGGEGIIEYKFSEEQNEQNSKARKEHLKNNPDFKEKMVSYLIEFHTNNPDFNRNKANKQFESQEYREWFGQRMKESYQKNGFKGGKKPISFSVTKDGIIYTFTSLSEASRNLKISERAFANLVKGKTNKVKGYILVKSGQ